MLSEIREKCWFVRSEALSLCYLANRRLRQFHPLRIYRYLFRFVLVRSNQIHTLLIKNFKNSNKMLFYNNRNNFLF